ncbi:MAG: hypothetical protein JWP72_21, partial [Massilia sp.]|nr:hypothetical protein [Massilia sp.]
MTPAAAGAGAGVVSDGVAGSADDGRPGAGAWFGC